MIEQALGVVLTERRATHRRLALRHILHGNQNPIPGVFVARQDAAAELDVEPFARQGIVDRLAEKFRLAVPQLLEFQDVGLEHVVAKDLVEILDELGEVRGAEQSERFGVDLDDSNAGRTRRDPLGPLLEIVTQRDDTLLLPSVEQGLERTVVFQPERDRRQIEHCCVVA